MKFYEQTPDTYHNIIKTLSIYNNTTGIKPSFSLLIRPTYRLRSTHIRSWLNSYLSCLISVSDTLRISIHTTPFTLELRQTTIFFLWYVPDKIFGKLLDKSCNSFEFGFSKPLAVERRLMTAFYTYRMSLASHIDIMS